MWYINVQQKKNERCRWHKMTGNQPVHLDPSDCYQYNTNICYIHSSGKVSPYNLLTTVRCSSLVLTTWTRAYSSYFTSTTIISLPSPKLAGGRRNDVLGQERHSGGSDRDCEFLPTGIWEFSCYVGLLNQAGHSPAGTVGSTGKYPFKSVLKMVFPEIVSCRCSPEAGVWKVQVSVQGWAENRSSHLHAGFTADEPLGVTGKSN